MTKPSHLFPMLFLSVTLCCAASTALACEEPSFDVAIPDGKTADMKEMEAAQIAVNETVAAGEQYVECINNSMKGARADRLVNSALDQMQAVAAQFNRQLRYFRRAN